MKQMWLSNMFIQFAAVARLLFPFCIFAEAMYYV